MFSRIETSIEHSRSGLGIGLALTKSIVELHGGEIKVHSTGTDQGSEFEIRLPLATEKRAQQVGSNPPEAVSVYTSKRILVVDDSVDSATSLQMLLNLAGNETTTAFDGLEAVRVAESFRPDVVLLDIGLPKLNGYEAARQIRQQEWGRHILLIALTGWGQEDDRQKSKDAGFNGHFVKPVDFNVLTNFLASVRHE